jgi:alanine racemase
LVSKVLNHPVISTKDVVRPTLVEVDLRILRENFLAIKKSVSPARIMPILKANAYGHGLVRIARLMQDIGAEIIGVAVLEEGILLRESGITMPILVLGGILGNQVPHFLKHELTITASSIDKVKQIDKSAAEMGCTAKVHLKIDTGMERIGVHYYSADRFLEISHEAENVSVEGIYTHFANAESRDLTYTRLQLSRFQRVLEFFEKRGVTRPPMVHCANSAAILRLPESFFNTVRPGLLLYGVYPERHIDRSVEVRPAMSWKSRVVYFKVIKPGHPVGYGSTWQSDRPVRAVTVPVGYGDGYFRSMSHGAHVIIRGKRYPVIGTISMDQIVVNIEWDSAYNEDPVVLLGEMNGERITCEDLAEWAGTIPYEILTNINTRVPRVYLGDN